MKTLLVTLSLAAASLTTAHAEIYRPSVVRDTTVLGAVAGALIGGHNNDHWAEGALIGAAAGAVVGSVIDHQTRPVVYQREIQPVAVVPCAPVVTSPPPQVVYVQPARRAPRVVYVQPAPAPVVVVRPVVYVAPVHGRYHHHHRDYRRW